MGAIGERIIELGSVDSTNKHAADLLAGGDIGHGTVIVAQEQTAGRGQRGRTWFSSMGLDLTASVVFRPEELKLSEQFGLAQVVALALHDVVSEMMAAAGRDAGMVRIKWPNDILVDRRKIAGILMENVVRGQRLHASIAGVGLNVNSTDLDIGLMATSLLLETGRSERVDKVLARLCTRLEARWQGWAEDPAVTQVAYVDRLWSRGRFMVFDLDGGAFTGRPLEVDPIGRLVVEDANGGVQAYGSDRLRFGSR